MNNNMYFPLFIDIQNKNILMIGGGVVAQRRVESMLAFSAHVTVVAPLISEKLTEYGNQGKITVIKKRYEEQDLEGRNIVLAATDNEVLNEEIGKQCREKNILVNVSSNHNLCDFYFPAVIVEDDFVIGITGTGKNHSYVKSVKDKIKECLKTRKQNNSGE